MTRNDALLAGVVFLGGAFVTAAAAYLLVNRLVYGKWLT